MFLITLTLQLILLQNELKCTDEYFEYVQPLNHRKELKRIDCDTKEEEEIDEENEDYFRLVFNITRQYFLKKTPQIFIFINFCCNKSSDSM